MRDDAPDGGRLSPELVPRRSALAFRGETVRLSGIILVEQPGAVRYEVQISPALPLGWSGTVIIDGAPTPIEWIAAGDSDRIASALVAAATSVPYEVEVVPGPAGSTTTPFRSGRRTPLPTTRKLRRTDTR